MQTIEINGQACQVNANEAREAKRLADFLGHDRSYVERSADVWLRSAPTAAAKARRQAVAKALGLPTEPAFI